jgi:anthranilate phosphoribosyltransferase
MGVYQPHSSIVATPHTARHEARRRGPRRRRTRRDLDPRADEDRRDQGHADRRYEITPEDFGFERATIDDIEGGDPAFNAHTIHEIFEGRDQGPRRDFVVLNNAFALYVAGVAASPQEGVTKAQETIDSGRATEKLGEFVTASHAVASAV